MPKELKLKEFKVNSFVTDFSRVHGEVKGGMGQTNCTGIACHLNIPIHTCECGSIEC